MRQRPARFIAAFACLQLVACGGDDDDGTMTETTPLSLARPPAPAIGSACATESEGVSTIERPMLPGASSTFGYSFKLHPGTDPDAATVIYLPGGPGQAGITLERDSNVPGELALLEIDPRGVGCNAPESPDYYPDDFYDSVLFADDVIAVIEQLGLDDYVLYGISYGTLLATIVASRLEARDLPAPRAIVLEGVLGEAFTPDRPSVEAYYHEEWREVRDSLEESIRTQLSSNPLPFGLTGEQWGAGFQGALLGGSSPLSEGQSFLYWMLQDLAPGSSDEQHATLQTRLAILGETPFDAMGERMYRVIACSEIADSNFDGVTLEGGELVMTPFDCEGSSLSEPFSAADWPVRAPIYYFSGTDDPSTPPWQAQAHFDLQPTASRQLVHIERGGHNPIALNLEDCAVPLWQAMAAGAGFEAALATCSWPHRLESAAAER